MECSEVKVKVTQNKTTPVKYRYLKNVLKYSNEVVVLHYWPPLGWTWPMLHLYAFPPIALLPGVLEGVRRDRVLLLLIARGGRAEYGSQIEYTFSTGLLWSSPSGETFCPKQGTRYFTHIQNCGNCGLGLWGGPDHILRSLNQGLFFGPWLYPRFPGALVLVLLVWFHTGQALVAMLYWPSQSVSGAWKGTFGYDCKLGSLKRERTLRPRPYLLRACKRLAQTF